MLDVYVKKGKQEQVTEQKKMKLDGWLDKPLHGQYYYASKTDEKGLSCRITNKISQKRDKKLITHGSARKIGH